MTKPCKFCGKTQKHKCLQKPSRREVDLLLWLYLGQDHKELAEIYNLVVLTST